MSFPAVTASKFSARRCRMQAGAAKRISSYATLYRPFARARTLAADRSACAARGLAPKRRYRLAASGASSFSGWVASTSRSAYSCTLAAIGTLRAAARIASSSSAPITFCASLPPSLTVRSTIAPSSSSVGNGTSTLNRNRSSCASGSG